MKTLGIISEFNPFHNGHKYLLDKAKRELNPDLSLSIMSGDFVQRGEASIMDKFTRASIAIQSGFDLIVEMPSFVSLQSAEFFALKSVSILDKMNVDYLVFGIENIVVDEFLSKSKIIIENQNNIDILIKDALNTGLSYPKAYNLAISNLVGSEFISSNNVLALEYLRAIYKINSKIRPYPIERIKTLNKDDTIKDKVYASSTAIRNNIDYNINKLMPEISYQGLVDFRNRFQMFDEEIVYNIFRFKLLIENTPMDEVIGYEEGIDNYLFKLAQDSLSYDDFLKQATSQRYTRSRIKRLVINYILYNKTSLNDTVISFIKVLGYNVHAANNFHKFSKNLEIIISKKNLNKLDEKNLQIYNKMIEASNLYSLGTNRNYYYDYKHNNRPIKW